MQGLKTLGRSIGLFLALLLSAQASAQEKLEIDGYCTYDGTPLEGDLYGFESDTQAQQAVKRVLDHTGLVQNFVIRAANVENAAAVIQGQQRLILYNQAFMLRVSETIDPDWAAISIMAHEVGHHLQGHTIQHGGSRPSIELEADRYSGYVLEKMGATLAQAQAAMQSLGSVTGSATHPPKSARLAAITNGWNAAREMRVQPPDVKPTTDERQTQTTINNEQDFPTSGSGTGGYVARAIFPGDPTAYFLTANNDIVGVPPGGTPLIIGRRLPASVPGAAWMYSTASVTYAVTPAGGIFGYNQWGQMQQVGHMAPP